MVFVKRNSNNFSRRSFGYAIFDEGNFDKWMNLFMIAETLRRDICLREGWPVGESYINNYEWCTVTPPEAYALSTHICDGYNKCVGNIPTIEELERDIKKYKGLLNNGED